MSTISYLQLIRRSFMNIHEATAGADNLANIKRLAILICTVKFVFITVVLYSL